MHYLMTKHTCCWHRAARNRATHFGMAIEGAPEQGLRDGAPMADPFPSLSGESYAAPSGTREKKASSGRPDVASQDAFPSLGGSAPAARPAGSAWVSKVPVIQRVTHQASVSLRLADDQLPRLSHLLNKVQQTCANVRIEASTTRKTNLTTFIIKGPSEASVQQAKKELTVLLARRVTLPVLIPASLRAFVIGQGGKNIKAITEETGVRIQIPPRTGNEQETEDPLLDEQVEVTIEGDEINAQQAQAKIQALVAERTSKITQRLTHIDHTYYPFIAGARNAHAAQLAETTGRGEVSVHVPPRGALVARDAPDNRNRDLSIIVSGERDAVAAVVAAIDAEVQDMKTKFRTLSMNIPKRQHAFLTGDSAADILEKTQCTVELPPQADVSDTVTIRGPQAQLPHALTAALEKANAVSVQSVDLGVLHTPGEHVRHLAQWLAHRVPRQQGVQVYFPKKDASAVEVVGADAAAVGHLTGEIEALAKPITPALVRTVELDPLAHGLVIGKKGQGLKAYEARGVDVLVPPENSGRGDVLLVLGRPAALQSLPSGAERDAAAASVLDGIAAELAQYGADAANMRTEQLEVPSKYHGAIVGPEGTVLNAIIGEDRLLIAVGAARDARAKQYASSPLTDDSIVIRGASDAVERAAAKIRAIAADAEQDAIVNGHVEELSVAPQHVPHLIGRGGAGVTKLREELGVKIDIGEPDAKRPVKIVLTGRKECVAEAKARLASQAQRLADEQTATLAVPSELFGSIIGQGGKYVTRLQEKYDVRINFPQDRKAAKGEVSIRGTKKGVEAAKAEILELIAYEQENGHVETFDVPSKAVPRILGKSGAMINQIRIDTGAEVDLERDGQKAALRLRGSKDAVAQARAAISEIVERVESEASHTLQVPARFHGALIGSGGANLREIITRAGAPEEAKSHAQYVKFPRASEPSDQVTVRGPKALAQQIADELEKEAKRLADRVVYGAAAPPSMHRQLISRGGTRQSDWQTRHQVSVVVPNWREYPELGTPANAAELEGVDAASIVKVVGPPEAIQTVLAEIAQLRDADAARRARSAKARIDQDP